MPSRKPESGDPERGIGTSEPAWSSRTADKNVAYWVPNIDNMITEKIRNILETYSHVPPEEIVKHVYETRERAWAIRAYPCTGSGLWLQPILPLTPRYHEILERVKSGASFMDIGCFLGVDLRQLVFDGAPSSNLYAVDIANHWDIGHYFFRDKDRFSAKYVEADILHADESDLAVFQDNSKNASPSGLMDIVSINHVLHQFNYHTQKAACVQIARLTRGPGSIVLGWQIGTRPGGPHHVPIAPPSFRHNADTMEKMWDEVGELTGTRWAAQVDLWDTKATGWKDEAVAFLGDDARLISFVVERLQ